LDFFQFLARKIITNSLNVPSNLIGLTLADPGFDWAKVEVVFIAPPTPSRGRIKTDDREQQFLHKPWTWWTHLVAYIEWHLISQVMLKFRVLLYQEESGLCMSNCLSGKGSSRVFFFSEFRTSSIAIGKRETEWSTLVQRHIATTLDHDTGVMEAETGKVNLK
jgi:hypothetical protein